MRAITSSIEKYSESIILEEGAYKATSSTIPSEIVARMVYSYRENPHIALKDLRYLTITHYDFDGNTKTGELIVNEQVAQEVMEIFLEIFQGRFPIHQMRLVDDFGEPGISASELDDRSMAANNSSAFFYRTVTGDPNRVSEHGLGLAIDLNTVQNPYVKGDMILPLEGQNYLNRDPSVLGLITKESVVYQAFKKRGWDWGGEWLSLKDFQHFQKQHKGPLLTLLPKKGG